MYESILRLREEEQIQSFEDKFDKLKKLKVLEKSLYKEEDGWGGTFWESHNITH